MAKQRQGEIWWANLPQPAGQRPVLILTRNKAIGHLHSVTIAPLTRTIRNVQSEVVLSPAEGVPTECAISLENILTIRKKILESKIARLSSGTMHNVFGAIRYVFDMPGD
jgi:mRNA interferase MazF